MGTEGLHVAATKGPMSPQSFFPSARPCFVALSYVLQTMADPYVAKHYPAQCWCESVLAVGRGSAFLFRCLSLSEDVVVIYSGVHVCFDFFHCLFDFMLRKSDGT